MPKVKKRNGPGRPKSGNTLNPQQIADVALQLIDSEGIEAFSMRRLGQQLGVHAMALYNHYRDKEAILDAVASRVLAQVPLPSEKGTWRSRFKALCSGVRGAARQNSHLFRLAMTRPLPPASGLPLVETALSLLADAGLKAEARIAAYHTCWLYVRAFCLWEIEEFSNKPSEVDLAGIAGSYPNASAALKLIFHSEAEGWFERGLDLILRGVSR